MKQAGFFILITMKPYSNKGKKFTKRFINCFGEWNDVDNLPSYESIQNPQETGYYNYEPTTGNLTGYVPKRTRNKKDIVAAHKRSSKKTERQQSKREICQELIK